MKVHLLFFTFVWCDVYTGKSYKDHGIFDITVTSANVGDVLKSLDTTFSLDWLKPHEGATYTIGTKTSILVDPEDKDAFTTVLQEQGIAYSNTNSIDAEIETAFTEIDSQKESRAFSFDEYHTVDQIDAWLNGEVNSHDNAKVSVYGKSIEGRDLTVVSIGNAQNPAIIVDCGMHAREWVSFAFCLYLINDLLNGEVAAWTNDIHWVIYPMLNPDGYQYSWTNDRYWRKNRNPNNGHRCTGVDLNRNYDIEWMKSGTSSYACHATYGGKGPFSEPETKFHRDHMMTIENKKAYLTYHAYSEFIIYPYSWSYAAEAYNKVELNNLANEMQYAIKSVNNKVYKYGEGAVAFGTASGGSDDWSHANGVPISYTVELRDTGHYGFLLPKTQILPTCLENIEGIRAVYEHVRPKDNCGETSCGENGTCIYRQPSNSLECLCKEGFEAAYRRPAVTCEPIVKQMSMEQHAGNRQDTVTIDPCPSTECWTYDSMTRACLMKNECATLTCGATAFDITFKSALFDIDDNQSQVTFAGGYAAPVWDGNQWTKNAPLGTNGMIYKIDSTTNEVRFSVRLAIVGNDMRTRTDDVEDFLITLGSQKVVTTPFGAAVTFECIYSMTVEVSTQSYTVNGVSVTDTFSASGSLASGFVMTLDTDGDNQFLMGRVLPVAVTWSVTGISTLTFYLKQCTVTHGSTKILIVKDGCYSAALEVEPQSNIQGFSFRVFKGIGESSPSQSIECTVDLCEINECQHPTSDSQCPTAGNDSFYNYKIAV